MNSFLNTPRMTTARKVGAGNISAFLRHRQWLATLLEGKERSSCDQFCCPFVARLKPISCDIQPIPNVTLKNSANLDDSSQRQCLCALAALETNGNISKSNAPGGGRTHNLWLRRPTLYPIELRVLEEWQNATSADGLQRDNFGGSDVK